MTKEALDGISLTLLLCGMFGIIMPRIGFAMLVVTMLIMLLLEMPSRMMLPH